MSKSYEHTITEPSVSFYTKAAWYSLIVPFVTPILSFLILITSNGRLDIPLITAFCFAVSSFFAGVISLFGIQRHGVKRILWKALIGIASSLVLAFLSFGYLGSLKTWHG